MEALKARDGHLINHWYIACLAKELPRGKPIQRILYDQPVVLFRGSDGRPNALPDRCLHRATFLSQGDCYDGNIRCPYHGWKYDTSGTVVEIPSEGAGLPKGKHFLKPLPTVEQDGAIWIWTGEGEPTQSTPPWRFPEYDNPRWANYFMITDFPNEVTHLAENFMDVPHTIFVHRGWFRSPKQQRVPMRLEVGSGSVLVTYDQPNDSIGFAGWLLNPKGEPMTHTDKFIFPNITRVDYHFGSTSGFIINSQITPVSTFKSRVYTYISFRVGFITVPLKPIMRLYTRKVIQQDVDIMMNQSGSFGYDSSMKFRSTDADEVHISIERLREMGVEGNPELYNFQKTRDKAFWI